MEQDYKVRVGITQGDINGIGYEVILKTLSDPRISELCTPVIYGSAKIAAYHRKALDLPPVNLNIVNSADLAIALKSNIINCVDEEAKVEFSKPSLQAGEAAYRALETAACDLEQGLIDVMVTAPINKNTIQSSEFYFPGHTEYLEKRLGKDQKSLMILMQESGLRVALVTGHIPLSQVAATVTKELILQKLTIFNQSLKQDFGIIKPRIAVLSLNPHAGDGGLLGREEEEIIKPALKESQEKGIFSFGPYPADGFFGSGEYRKFDGVLAMYHDQGLAPFKTIAMEEGVNYTAGLPFVRTSPAHGTAYDIAGENKANEESFRQAIYTAIDVFHARQAYHEMRQNPLRRQYYDKSGDNEVLDLGSEQSKD